MTAQQHNGHDRPPPESPGRARIRAFAEKVALQAAQQQQPAAGRRNPRPPRDDTPYPPLAGDSYAQGWRRLTDARPEIGTAPAEDLLNIRRDYTAGYNDRTGGHANRAAPTTGRTKPDGPPPANPPSTR